LYQDDLLPELYDDWIKTRREQLQLQFAEVLARLTALLESIGDYPAAIRHATRLIALDPLRESSYQNVMLLHIRNRDRSSVLRVYHQCVRTLKRELGISPAEATRELYAQALRWEDEANAPAEPPPHIVTKPSPLVGRGADWDELRRCWRSATQGESRFALIRGEPGIGKSRLAEELLEFSSRETNAASARARCYCAQGQLAYGPVAEWLRAAPLRSAREKISKTQLAELARVLPEVLVENPDIPAPQPLTESWQRLHFYEALNATIRAAAKPLLLLIDDLQWCDQDSLEWLHALFRSGSGDRILVLGTVRPEETPREHLLTGLARELRGAGKLFEISLAPLTAAETNALAIQTAGRECDPGFLNDLYHSTKGNPLFIVESVRAAFEDQARKSSTPPRVQAVISARLAQLSASAYELAGLAATIGRPFTFELLAKATDWDEGSLFQALEELWQRRIIDGQGAGTYDYTHDLLREVACQELSPIRRRSLHRRVGRALEELHAQDLEAVSGHLAAHYDAAGMAEQSIRFYTVAASVATQRFADAEAADLIRRALQLCRDLPHTTKRDKDEIDLLAMLGPSLFMTHGYSMPEVGETYDRAVMLAERSGDNRHSFWLLSGAWLFHVVRGNLEESRRLAQRCLDGARHDGKPVLEMASHFILGSSLFHLGQLAASREHIELAIPSSGNADHPALALFAGPDIGVFCRAYSSHLLWQLGHADEAAAKSDEAIALAREVSHPFSLAIALSYAAMLSVLRGERKLAQTRAAEAGALSGRHSFAYYAAFAEILGGWGAAVDGDPAGGLTRLRAGIDSFRATQAEVRLPFYYGLLAEAYGVAGRPGEALASISTGFAFLSKNGETWAAPELHRIQGDLLLQSGDETGARAGYERAIEAARQTGARLFELRAADRLKQLRVTDRAHANTAER
jgi:predicted ATPase